MDEKVLDRLEAMAERLGVGAQDLFDVLRADVAAGAMVEGVGMMVVAVLLAAAGFFVAQHGVRRYAKDEYCMGDLQAMVGGAMAAASIVVLAGAIGSFATAAAPAPEAWRILLGN